MAHVYGSKNNIGCWYLLLLYLGRCLILGFASVGSRLAGPMGMQRLYSLPLTGSAGLIDPLHHTQFCVIMGIWTQAPHLHSKHLTCSAIFPPWDWPFVSSFDNSQMVVRDQLYNGG